MNTRFSRLGVVVLLLAVLLVPTIVAAQEPPPAPPEPQFPESEPNDAFYDYNYLSLNGRRHGRIDPAGDRDTYHSWFYDPTLFHVDVRLPDSSPLTMVIALYDGSQNLIAEYECPRNGRCLTYQTEGWSDLYLVVTDAHGNAGPQYEYSFMAFTEVMTIDPNEPNDFISEATPYTVGETMAGLLEPRGDIDTFSFHLEARQEVIFNGYDFETRFLDADGQILASSNFGQPIFLAPESGTYYVQIIEGPDRYEFALVYIQRPIYASFSGAGVLDGVAFKPGDILVYTSLDATWRMAFRAADYGLKGNLAAFDVNEYGQFYLTYSTAQSVPNVGPMTPHDVLLYIPGNPEWGTDAEWSLVFDGSQLGLTTSAERLDALTVESSYDSYTFYLSTTGKAQFALGGAQWHVANNDVMVRRQSQYWSDLRGLLSGPANGFGRANVIGLDADYETIYLAFDRGLTLGGVPLGRGDIVACGRPGYWETTCESFSKVFDASDAGVGSYKIDGIDVGFYETP